MRIRNSGLRFEVTTGFVISVAVLIVLAALLK